MTAADYISLLFCYGNKYIYSFRYGIKVEGYSSDGDVKLLSTMEYHTKLNMLADIELTPDRHSALLCLQDTVHMGTKLRNRLLAICIALILGNRLISLSHLKLLINNVDKAIHGLVMKDICPDDRQNFKSLQKMMQQRVYDSLSDNVVGSEGTVMYLKLCEMVTSSLIDDALKPEERIYKLTYAAYFCRAWRKWLQNSNLSVDENFISRNAYVCIELNAINLILLTKRFRDQNIEEFFLPTLFNSQPNEEIFRQFRSLTTINYTKINFTLLELFHLVGRVELQNDIIYFKLAKTDIKFPRNKLNRAQLNRYKLPSDMQISETAHEAKMAALQDVSKFGMEIQITEIESCELLKPNILQTSQHILLEEPENIVDSDEENFGSQDSEVRTSNVEITLANGTKKTIRKSTYLWTLTDSMNHLSNDRLKRVQGVKKVEKSTKSTKPTTRRLVFRKETNYSEPILTLSKCENLQIGDWAIFQITDDTELVFVLGNILSFRYIEGKTRKERQYSWDFAPVKVDENVKPRGIEVLASWYKIGSTTTLLPIYEVNSFYVDMKNYVFNLICKNIKLGNNCLTFTEDKNVLLQLQEQLARFTNKIES